MPSEAVSGQQSARTGFFEKRQLQRYAESGLFGRSALVP